MMGQRMLNRPLLKPTATAGGSDYDAFILIGGKSSRFGQDKASAVFERTTLVERTSATVQQALSPLRTTLVAANEHQPAAKFATEKEFSVITDIYADRGPFGAVHAALTNAKTEWALVLGCDFPFISPELLLRLAGFICDETDAITPIQNDGNYQPLCSFYRVEPCLKAVREILEADRTTPPLKTVFKQVRTRFIEFSELNDLPNASNFFLNINTPDDFQIAVAIVTSK